MKWIGALLLIGATTTIGYFISSRLTHRPKQIRLLIHALQLLEAEMMYSQLPLHELFKTISKKMPHPIDRFFINLSEELKGEVNDFHQLWHKEVNILMKQSALKHSEIDVLNQFGSNLGQHNIIQQQKHIRLAMTHLNRELEEAIDERDTYDKMTKSTGFLVGLFIVIIFI